MKLSILIAAYNVAPFIEKCVLSCEKQDLEKHLYEIIVVNDGSTDDSLNLLEKLKTEVSNLVIISQKNSGLGAARNIALKHAKGEYVWFIDGDDYIGEHILKKILNEINSKQLDILVLDYAIVNENYEVTKKNANNITELKGVCSGSDFYIDNHEKSYTVLYVFKKRLFDLNRLLFQERINMQDSEILPKLLFYTNRISFLKLVSYYYVQQPNSFTNSIDGAKRYAYFLSIIVVRNSLIDFQEKIKYIQPDLAFGIDKKLEGLQHILYNHLLFFSYENEWLVKIIKLLKENKLYPLQYKAKGKMQILKIGLNSYPVVTKWFVDKIQALRK